jgi:DNA-binding NtrC family response regulator
MAKVVIIDDEASILDLMTKFCKGMGHEVVQCQTGTAGLNTIRETRPDLVIVDLRIGDIDGLEIIKQTRTESPNTAIIMVTGHGSVETAVEAMRLGAFDYLTKPFELTDLKRTMEHALGPRGAPTPGSYAPQAVPATPGLRVVGGSAVIQKILSIIQRVADNDSPVLLEGEFGVGKQLIARALHEGSRRNAGPFKAIQCSALPQDLLEAELFGHGTPQNSIFARTRGGTIHIAEIHQMPMRIQAQLNAFLEQAQVSAQPMYNGSGFNFRLITSTTAHLEDAIRDGKFREDLYYKLSVVPVMVPPLRERREDIPMLVEHFLREQAMRSGGPMKKMEGYAQEFLDKYPWPGNISELRNAVERACALAEGEAIKPTDLPAKVTQKVEAPMDPASGEGKQRLPIGGTLDEFIRGQEKLFINETLKYNNGSREKTASMLGVSIATLYRKMELNVERKTTS